MRTRYGDRFDCDGCKKEAHYYRVKKRRSYACEHCGHQVYPTAGTPFHRTRTSLRDWFFVMFQFCASRNGVAAKEVERQIGVTYKTAWRMCHEIRKYMAAVDGDEPVGGFGKGVEVDETFVGGYERNGQDGRGKTIVFGVMAKGGDIITQVVPNRRRNTLLPLIQQHVRPRSDIHTDTHVSYLTIRAFNGYGHQMVNHDAGEYVSRSTGATVNGIEGFWAQLKRGINGTHVHVSEKYLPNYLGEFEFRHNRRNVPHSMLDELMFSFRR